MDGLKNKNLLISRNITDGRHRGAERYTGQRIRGRVVQGSGEMPGKDR